MHRTILAGLMLAVIGTAHASGNSYQSSTNGQKACDPALPIYDTNLRQRPRGAVNESTSGVAVFATCGFDYQSNSYGTEWVEAIATNVGTSPQTVTCTAVVGREGQATEFLTKTASIPAGGTAAIRWTPGSRWQTDTALSCRLPNGTGIARTVIQFLHSHP